MDDPELRHRREITVLKIQTGQQSQRNTRMVCIYILGCVGLKQAKSNQVRALSDLSPYEENIKYEIHITVIVTREPKHAKTNFEWWLEKVFV